MPSAPTSLQISLSRRSPYLPSNNHHSRISGLMLANHTSITSLFQRTLDQFDRLWKRQAFLEPYKKQSMFENGLGEFEDAREIVRGLVHEYKKLEPTTAV